MDGIKGAEREYIPARMLSGAWSAAARIIPGVIGLLMSRAQLSGGLIAPFGAAWIAAVLRRDTAAAIIGVVLGYMLPGNDGDTLRLVATALAVGGIRWALAELRPVSAHPAFPPTAAFAGTMLTGIVVTSSVGAVIGPQFLFYLAEGMLAAAAAFFFIAAPSSREIENRERLTMRSMAAALSVISIAAVPLCALRIGGFAPVGVVIMLFSIAAAGHRGVLCGCAAGLTAGLVMSLAWGEWQYAGICAAAGLLAGLCSRFGRIMTAAIFSIVCSSASLLEGSVNIFFIAQTISASVIYPLLRDEWVTRIIDILTPTDARTTLARCDSGSVVERLNTASSALTGVSHTIEAVAGRLDARSRETPQMVCRQAAKRVCTGCGIAKHCWQTAAQNTAAQLELAARAIEQEGKLSYHNAPELLSKRCARSGELIDMINSLYADYTARQAASRRIAQMRAVVSDQLGGVGQLLSDMARDMRENELPDRRLCADVSAAVEAAGYRADAVSCIHEPGGGTSIKISAWHRSRRALARSGLADFIGAELGMELEQTGFERTERGFDMTMRQVPEYVLRCAAAQTVCSGEKLCGDSYDMLETQDSSYIILSDGMGCGGRAAVDSAMTCALLGLLLKAGFEPQSALRLVNASLLVKSEDESLSTVDCLHVDRFSGRACLIKAGAARSYLLRRGEVRIIEKASLPLGILRSTDAAGIELQLEPGDIVVLTSDGADKTDEPIVQALRAWDKDEPAQLADHLLECVGSTDDDVTILCAVLERNFHES